MPEQLPQEQSPQEPKPKKVYDNFHEFVDPARRMLNTEPQLDVSREKHVNIDPEVPDVGQHALTTARVAPAPEEKFINSVPGMDPVPTPAGRPISRGVVTIPEDQWTPAMRRTAAEARGDVVIDPISGAVINRPKNVHPGQLGKGSEG